MITDVLKKSEVFSTLREKELKEISSFFEKLHFKDNEYIFMEGDLSEWFYIVAQGRVKVVKHTIMGKDIILEVMSPGDVFGGIQEIAEMVGTTVETCIRTMSKFQKQGMVKSSRGKISVNTEFLREYLGD